MGKEAGYKGTGFLIQETERRLPNFSMVSHRTASNPPSTYIQTQTRYSAMSCLRRYNSPTLSM
jgi:hypothetical protein